MEDGPIVFGGIAFFGINANAVNDMSGIFVGNNRQDDWISSDKTNSGFGRSNGRGNMILGALNVVIDPDYMDNPDKMILSSVNVKSSIL